MRMMARVGAHVVLLLLLPATTWAEVRMPGIFSDHMVLQSADGVPVWGQADPGESVTIRFNGRTGATQAGADGRWVLNLNLKDSAPGPFEMVVAGINEIKIRDVLVGQVWLASGQSNMERLLKQTAGAEQEIAGSGNPMIRQFKVPRAACDIPARDCKGEWVLADPSTTPDFTAVGYYFAKRLQKELGCPVGIINSTWGGTFSEAWTSAESIAEIPSLAAGAELRRNARLEHPVRIKSFTEKFSAWLRETGRMDAPADPAPFLAGPISGDGWIPLTLPGKVAAPGLPEYGAVWVRREVEVPPAAIAAGLNVYFGGMNGFQTVYWNGRKISETTPETFAGEGMARVCGIVSELLKPGKNVMAIRIFAPSAPPSFNVSPQLFNAGPVSLSGTWLAKSEFSLPSPTVLPPKPPRQFSGPLASELFNGMIFPLVPFRLAGVIWYQGEANRGRGWEYRESFLLLIKDWRKFWPGIPFYFCQLANYSLKKTEPSESEWAETREAQSRALSLPATGQAVLIDIGEAGDIHPRNKKDVGERLADIALAQNYGKNVVPSGPVFDSMRIEGNAIRLRFLHAEGGLVARPLPARYDVRTLVGETAPLVRNSPDSELEGFAICGADHKWVWADAKIDGDSVLVSSDRVPVPIAVRYGWADNPTCNLCNGAGLPASPFRTDDFPAITKDNVFGPDS